MTDDKKAKNDKKAKKDLAKMIPYLEDMAEEHNKGSALQAELSKRYPLVESQPHDHPPSVASDYLHDGRRPSERLSHAPEGFRTSHEADREGIVYDGAIYERPLAEFRKRPNTRSAQQKADSRLKLAVCVLELNQSCLMLS